LHLAKFCRASLNHLQVTISLSQAAIRASTLQATLELPHDPRAEQVRRLQQGSKQLFHQRPVLAAQVAIRAACA